MSIDIVLTLHILGSFSSSFHSRRYENSTT
nr:MAG TPA: Pesticin immunity protein [Caudoviricetes sp.]